MKRSVFVALVCPVVFVLFLLFCSSLTKRFYYGRNLLVATLQMLPLPSTILGPPKGHIWAKEDPSLSYHPLLQEKTETIPLFPFEEIYKKSVFKRGIAFFPETFVVEVPQGRIWGPNGVVITRDDLVLADTAIDWIPSIEYHKVFRKNKLSALTNIDETVAVVASKSPECYYHWMFDILPKLEILKKSGIAYDKIYLNPITRPYQRETLKQLGVDEKKIIWATPRTHLCAKKLVVPSLAGGFKSNIPPWVCQFHRAHFLEKTEKSSPALIYISRGDAPTRKIVNERELVEALSKKGFVEVKLSELTVRQQAELFSDAKCIVAPHGAGLTNLIFCKPQTQVIEIFSPGYLNDCYWNLTCRMDIAHHCLKGAQTGLPPQQVKDNDICVNIDEVLAYLPS